MTDDDRNWLSDWDREELIDEIEALQLAIIKHAPTDVIDSALNRTSVLHFLKSAND